VAPLEEGGKSTKATLAGDTRRLERSACPSRGMNCDILRHREKVELEYYPTLGQQKSDAFSAAPLTPASEHRRIAWSAR
jgi:hypothetical protein